MLTVQTTPTSPGAIIEAARIRMVQTAQAVTECRAAAMSLTTDMAEASRKLDVAFEAAKAAEQAYADALAAKHQPAQVHGDPVGDADKSVDDDALFDQANGKDHAEPAGERMGAAI